MAFKLKSNYKIQRVICGVKLCCLPSCNLSTSCRNTYSQFTPAFSQELHNYRHTKGQWEAEHSDGASTQREKSLSHKAEIPITLLPDTMFICHPVTSHSSEAELWRGNILDTLPLYTNNLLRYSFKCALTLLTWFGNKFVVSIKPKGFYSQTFLRNTVNKWLLVLFFSVTWRLMWWCLHYRNFLQFSGSIWNTGTSAGLLRGRRNTSWSCTENYGPTKPSWRFLFPLARELRTSLSVSCRFPAVSFSCLCWCVCVCVFVQSHRAETDGQTHTSDAHVAPRRRRRTRPRGASVQPEGEFKSLFIDECKTFQTLKK